MARITNLRAIFTASSVLECSWLLKTRDLNDKTDKIDKKCFNKKNKKL